MSKEIFVACSMSGLNEIDYKARTLAFQSLVSESNNNIFCEIVDKADGEFQTPEDGTTDDIVAINNCEEFVLVHFSDIQSSTLFELGIAFACGKVIKIYYMDANDLPFMLKSLDKVSDNVTLVKIDDVMDIDL